LFYVIARSTAVPAKAGIQRGYDGPTFIVDDVNDRVGIGTATPNKSLEINSPVANASGLRFTNLTSASPTGGPGTKVLSVDVNGDVVLMDDNLGGGPDDDWVRNPDDPSDIPDSVLCSFSTGADLAGYVGLARGGAGNAMYGTNVFTHINWGVGCTTGRGISNDIFCTVSGGIYNVANNDYSTVGGGRYNRAVGVRATVAGGWTNEARTIDAAVGGGDYNIAADTGSVVAGGHANEAYGVQSAICGGLENEVCGKYAGVFSGLFNRSGGTIVDTSGGESDTGSVICGGIRNTITDRFSVISGGRADTISGSYSVIPGGRHNVVSGDTSLAFGSNNNVSGDLSMAFGRNVTVTNDHEVAFYTTGVGNTGTVKITHLLEITPVTVRPSAVGIAEGTVIVAPDPSNPATGNHIWCLLNSIWVQLD